MGYPVGTPASNSRDGWNLLSQLNHLGNGSTFQRRESWFSQVQAHLTVKEAFHLCLDRVALLTAVCFSGRSEFLQLPVPEQSCQI